MPASHDKRRIVHRFTVSYVLLMLIPILMGIITFFVSSRVLWQNIQESNAQHLSSAGALVDDAYAAADEFVLSLVSNGAFSEIIHHQVDINPYQIRQVANTLPTLRTANHIVDRYFFYYHDQQDEFIIGPHLAFPQPDLYYASCFRYGDMTSESFFSMIQTEKNKRVYPAADSVYLSVTSSTVLMTIPYVTSNTSTPIHVLFYFDQGRLIDMFSPLMDAGTQWFGIFDRTGTLLTASDGENPAPISAADIQCAAGQTASARISAGGKDYTLQSFRAESSGWLFAALIPDAVYIAQSASVLWIVGAFISLFILFSIVLTWTITHYNSKPLAQLVNSLPIDDHGNSRGFWPIHQAVEKLVLDNEQLNGLLGAQQIQLRDAVISQLVKGNFENEREMELLLSRTGVELPGPDYRGVYMKILNQSAPNEANLDHLNHRHTLLAEVLSAFAPALQLLTLKTSSEYILLFSHAPEKPLEKVIADVYTTLKNTYNLDAVFFVGIPCQSLTTLNQSFTHAQLLALNGAGEERYLNIAEKKPLNKTVYDYTAQDELSLVASAQRNEMDKIAELLTDIYQRNFNQRRLGPFMRQALFSAMLHTLSRSDCPLTLPGELTNVPLRMPAEGFFQALHAQYQAICHWTQENRRRDSKLTMDNVLRFIHENFADSNMSLSYTATHFGLTEQYLSECFKKRVEMNFSGYVEHLRISRAQTLLRTTTESVQDIAQQVGYANIRTFRRAYSRVLSHPPSDDRQGLSEDELQ